MVSVLILPPLPKIWTFILDNVVRRKDGIQESKRTKFETRLSHRPADLGLNNSFNFSEYIFSPENGNRLRRLSYARPSKMFVFFFLFLFPLLPFLSLLFLSLLPPPSSPPLKINHWSCQSSILDNFPLLSIPAFIIISLTRTLNLVLLPLFPPTLNHPALSSQLHKYLIPLCKTYHYFSVASKRKPKLLGNAAKTLHDLSSTYFSSLFCCCCCYLVAKSCPTLLWPHVL